MKVLNVHDRVLNFSTQSVVELINTLASKNDKVWPSDKWPSMKFKDGIAVGAVGGHGPIKYKVEIYDPAEIIQFRFLKPNGFNGIHKFEFESLSDEQTKVRHTIMMNTSGKATFLWLFGIRSLHDALIEDAFDKMQRNLSDHDVRSKWSFYVRLLRRLLG